MLFYKSLHHSNYEQQNSRIVDTPSIETRNDMNSVVLFCMGFIGICAAMPGESGYPKRSEMERAADRLEENRMSPIANRQYAPFSNCGECLWGDCRWPKETLLATGFPHCHSVSCHWMDRRGNVKCGQWW